MPHSLSFICLVLVFIVVWSFISFFRIEYAYQEPYHFLYLGVGNESKMCSKEKKKLAYSLHRRLWGKILFLRLTEQNLSAARPLKKIVGHKSLCFLPKIEINMQLWRENFTRVIFLTNHFLCSIMIHQYSIFSCFLCYFVQTTKGFSGLGQKHQERQSPAC